MAAYVLFALYALAASVLIGLVFKELWSQHDQRTFQEKWGERERLLDHPRTRAARHKIRERRSRPVGTRDRDSQRRLQIVERELVEVLHKDFVAEEAEGLIEIRLDRRQSPTWQAAQAREPKRRRDPQRNRAVTSSLRKTGWAFVRQPVPPPTTALPIRPCPDVVALGK